MSLKAFHTLIWWYTRSSWYYAALRDGGSSDGSILARSVLTISSYILFLVCANWSDGEYIFSKTWNKRCRSPQASWILHKKRLPYLLKQHWVSLRIFEFLVYGSLSELCIADVVSQSVKAWANNKYLITWFYNACNISVTLWRITFFVSSLYLFTCKCCTYQ